jgi:hypothetical protein
MISISAILFNQKAHLPATWRGKDGLRALFPPGYSGSVSALKHYVFSFHCELGAQGYALGDPSPTTVCLGYFWVMADAQGHWFFGWRYGTGEEPSANPRQGSIAFKFAVDGLGLGYLDKSAPPALTTSCNAGTDDRIAKHWPQLFASGVEVLFQLGSAPDPSKVWALAGFTPAQSAILSGSNVASDGSMSGSSFFRFPTVTADVVVAGIISGAVAQSLKANTPVSADTDVVKQKVTSTPSLPAAISSSVLDFLTTGICAQVISDARTIATRIFHAVNGTAATADANNLSALLTTYQLLAAGQVAYRALGAPVPAAPVMWNVVLRNSQAGTLGTVLPPPPAGAWYNHPVASLFDAIVRWDSGDKLYYFSPDSSEDLWDGPPSTDNSNLVSSGGDGGIADGGDSDSDSGVDGDGGDDDVGEE